MEAPRFDYRDPGFLAGDRHPAYRRLRDEMPVARIGPKDSWIVTRYDDVAAILSDKDVRMQHDPHRVTEALGDGPAARMYRNSLGVSDPPNHGRLRKLVSYAFTPKALRELQARIDRVAADAIDDLAAEGETDIVSSYARRIPMYVICGMLGAPITDGPRLLYLAGEFGRIFFAEGQNKEAIASVNAVCDEFFEFFGRLIAAKRAHPADDIASVLVAAQDGGDRLNHDELVAVMRGIVTAGLDTTAALIGNAVWGLLRHREQLAILKARPDLVPNAVEEFLRWEAPFQGIHRYLTKDLELHGQTLRAGDRAWLMLAAANRDDRRYAEPDRLDVTRQGIEHLAFGGGIHYCLGAALARMEGKAALDAFVGRLRDGELLVEKPQRRPDFLLAWIERLPIRYSMAT